MQDELLNELKQHFQKNLAHLQKELAGIRTGRANASLVEDIAVESYGVKMPLRQLATVSIPESRTIAISPWDKNSSKDIQRSLELAIGVNVQNDGNIIRVNLPSLTEENRRELVKIVGKKLEEERISMRASRHEIIEKIEKSEMGKEDADMLKKRIQEEVDRFNIDSKKIAEDKEKDIMKV